MAEEKEVRRKIHFYLAHMKPDEATNEIKQFNVTLLNDHIHALSDNDRQLERTDGNVTFCRIFSGGKYPRLRLSTVRMDVIPEGFDRRDSSSWPFNLEEQQGMIEHSHMVLLPNNIVGVERSQHGPGVGKLEEYLHQKAASIIDSTLSFKMLMDKEFDEKLKSMTNLRELRIRVSHRQVEEASSREIDSEEDDPYRVLESMKGFGEAPEYEIAWKNKTNTRGHIKDWFRSVAGTYLRRYDTEDKSAKLLLVGDNEEGHREEINVLNERLVFDEQAIRVSNLNRSITPESGFGAIEKAYTENRERIERAGVIHL